MSDRIIELLEANNRLVEQNRDLQRKYNVAASRQVALGLALADALRFQNRSLPDVSEIPGVIIARSQIGSISGKTIFEITGEELALLSLAAKLESKPR